MEHAIVVNDEGDKNKKVEEFLMINDGEQNKEANTVVKEAPMDDGSLAMLLVGFTNAFNLVGMIVYSARGGGDILIYFFMVLVSLWLESNVIPQDEHIMSTTRVNQGDPLRPLLFSFVLHLLIHHISEKCKLLLHTMYVDGSITEDS